MCHSITRSHENVLLGLLPTALPPLQLFLDQSETFLTRVEFFVEIEITTISLGTRQLTCSSVTEKIRTCIVVCHLP